MPLILPVPPQAAFDALNAGLQPLSSSPSLTARLPNAAKAVAHFAPSAAARSAQHPGPNLSLASFVLDLKALAHHDLSAARPSGWHHLLPTGVGPALVLARTAQLNNQHTFAALSESPFSDELQARIATLQKDPQVLAGSFEAVLLQVPALHILAVWLKDASHHQDLVVPLAPVFPPLTAGQHYTAMQFLSALRPLAQARLQSDDPRQGS